MTSSSIVFFGSSEHSLPVLKKLLDLPQFPLLAVVSQPDQPTGRDQKITPNPVTDFARQKHLPLFQPKTLNQEFAGQLRQLKPDLGLCVAYGPPFFTPELIDIPRYKIVNIHPSPLPKYRGATPGPWQIINGESKSAVTFFQIDPLPDHGPIINQFFFPISPRETTASFYQKAFRLAAQNLEYILIKYINHPAQLTPQNHSQKTYFPRLVKDSARINWSDDPATIERFIRAMIPWPVAWTYVRDQKNKLLKMKVYTSRLENQELQLDQVQIEAKTKTIWAQIKPHYSLIVQPPSSIFSGNGCKNGPKSSPSLASGSPSGCSP